MSPTRIQEEKLLSWASDIDENTLDQAIGVSRLPFVDGVALMPDAHLGRGATVGSVIATSGAIMPAAVGVDLGCGMAAVETDLRASDLPDDLEKLLPQLEKTIPSGVGKSSTKDNEFSRNAGRTWLSNNHHRFDVVTDEYSALMINQMGTLGSGNHFFEICLDERNVVWIVLHSGSRGIGNKIASWWIKKAKAEVKRRFISLQDPDHAYFVQGDKEFAGYMREAKACQDWAFANRSVMLSHAKDIVFAAVGKGHEIRTINCHHNFVDVENHHGKDLFITRKGAIRARETDSGIIPGSMGTKSYIIQGTGSKASFASCSHGAGRRMSRTKAKEKYDVEDLRKAMEGKIWNSDKAKALIDEIPDSYKSIDQVMEDQKDLVTIQHTLHQILNYKGT